MVKRSVDIVLALVLIAFLTPVIIAIALAVWASMGRPVLFAQYRAGLRGEPFLLRKFRSMSELRDAEGALLPDDQRVTALGRFLRRTRLDELPELALILSGEMSFVGPRPLYPRTVEASRLGELRGQTRPGLTGLAQVSGNTLLSDEEKIALDVYYVNKHGPAADLLILLRTVGVILFGERRDEALIQEAVIYANGLDRCS